jgi:hypothetical protein
LLAAAAAGAYDAGCSASKPTELVPGVLTQVQVPRDLTAIRVEVDADGARVFCNAYQVYDGKVELPRTLGVVSGASPASTVTVEIRGYAGAAATGDEVKDCNVAGAVDAPMNASAPRVIRRSIQSFVDGHILFLPMPLDYSCFDTDCTTAAGDQSCRGAQCNDAHVDPTTLVDFDPELLDGRGICFSPSLCFADAQPAVPVDAANCVFGFAVPPPGTGLNVRVFYEDFVWSSGPPNTQVPVFVGAGEKEILDGDPVEGFTVVPATPANEFKLAPGLCQLVKNATLPPPPDPMNPTKPFHVISAMQVASACPTKKPLLPICAPEAEPADGGPNSAGNLLDGGTTTDGGCNVGVPLEPAPSALYIVVDDSKRMHAALGPGGFATVVGLSLDNPVFRRLFVAFKRFAHQQSDCDVSQTMTTLTAPDVKFALAQVNQQPIANLIGMGAMATDQPYYLQGAMRASGAYQEVTAAPELSGLMLDKRAVMFFVNAAPDTTTDCNPPLEATVVKTLSDEAAAAAAQVDTYFVLLANDDANATQAAYVPPGLPPVSVPFNAGCTGSAMVDGWNIDGGRIRICGASCVGLRGAVEAVTGLAFQKNQPAPDVPVTAALPCQ